MKTGAKNSKKSCEKLLKKNKKNVSKSFDFYCIWNNILLDNDLRGILKGVCTMAAPAKGKPAAKPAAKPVKKGK